jgi:hypothetical protein
MVRDKFGPSAGGRGPYRPDTGWRTVGCGILFWGLVILAVIIFFIWLGHRPHYG